MDNVESLEKSVQHGWQDQRRRQLEDRSVKLEILYLLHKCSCNLLLMFGMGEDHKFYRNHKDFGKSAII